jgi:hypothetical protein
MLLGGLSSLVSADLNESKRQQLCQFLDLRCDVANTHGAMVRRTLGIPEFHKLLCANRKAVTAVGISNLQDRARYRLPLRNYQLISSLLVFSY